MCLDFSSSSFCCKYATKRVSSYRSILSSDGKRRSRSYYFLWSRLRTDKTMSQTRSIVFVLGAPWEHAKASLPSWWAVTLSWKIVSDHACTHIFLQVRRVLLDSTTLRLQSISNLFCNGHSGCLICFKQACSWRSLLVDGNEIPARPDRTNNFFSTTENWH